jgi:outer membrane receptor for Fe3+-dicitrate
VGECAQGSTNEVIKSQKTHTFTHQLCTSNGEYAHQGIDSHNLSGTINLIVVIINLYMGERFETSEQREERAQQAASRMESRLLEEAGVSSEWNSDDAPARAEAARAADAEKQRILNGG